MEPPRDPGAFPAGPATTPPRPMPGIRPDLAPHDLGQSSSPGAWFLVWTIVVVKLITVVVTIAVARSWDAGAVLALTTWPWLLAIAALVAGPLLFRRRLRRVRARRAQLLRAEWMLDDGRPDEAAEGRS